MATVLGIDLGTQSVKVLIYDFDAGRSLAVASAPLDLYQTEDGVAEQQAHWWTDALKQALADVPADLRKRVVAIGVSGQQHGFVPLDATGEVLAPVKLWCDTSTSAECEAIMQDFGGFDACIEAVGNPILPGYTASKVRHFRDAQPAAYATMDCILLPHDYLNFWLTGERCMEAGDASGTGFLDIRTRQWSARMLRAIDPDRDLGDCLPEVSVDRRSIGKLLPAIAAELALPPSIPVATGGGDNMMGAIGTGNVEAGMVTVSLGTSGTIYACSEQPVIDPAGSIAAFCSSTGAWLPLLCTMNCTVSTELMRKFAGADVASFEAALESVPPGSNGLITVPFFNGERTPNLPNARGALLGLDGRNFSQANLFRSAVEGATFALRYGFDAMRSLGVNATEIVLTGGGANSATWRQVVADVFATPVTVLENNEGAAMGAALQAFVMLEGESADYAALARRHLARDEARSSQPQPSAVAAYEAIYNEYQRAVDSVAALYT